VTCAAEDRVDPRSERKRSSSPGLWAVWATPKGLSKRLWGTPKGLSIGALWAGLGAAKLSPARPWRPQPRHRPQSCCAVLGPSRAGTGRRHGAERLRWPRREEGEGPEHQLRDPRGLTQHICGTSVVIARRRRTVHLNAISYRLFQCARCAAQVRLCRPCDRGNRYCGDICSRAARRKSTRRAGARHQETTRGRANHAARQQRYLDRREAKMTHQGSPPASRASGFSDPTAPLVLTTENAHAPIPAPQQSPPLRCSRCHRPLSGFARRHVLRTGRGPPRG